MGQREETFLDRLCGRPTDRAGLPSVAIVAAHPDDEVIGAGACLTHWRSRLTLIHVTDGSPRNLRDARTAGCDSASAYARVRREEMLAALELAGLASTQAIQLSYADQEASFHLTTLTGELADLLRHLRPDVVLTHPYEGGHPDHDATVFAVHLACRRLGAEPEAAPCVLEMTSYHNRLNSMEVYQFLPSPDCHERTVTLSENERRLKRRMLGCFVTQQVTLGYFPVAIERFRPAPDYDFREPPHQGTLFYELFDWGITGTHWRAEAQAALRSLNAMLAP